ncbi:MAG TPA: hypothetical protein VK756_10180 [Solirubrobacteraceae bacterium]|nr:hypothetical protein [Solirubrobacteraceae bacterium]
MEDTRAPAAPSERGAWTIALALLALGVGVLAAALSGALGSSRGSLAPPAVLQAARTPSAASASARAILAGRGAPAAGPYAGAAGARSDAVAGGAARGARKPAAAGGVVATPAATGGVLASPMTAAGSGETASGVGRGEAQGGAGGAAASGLGAPAVHIPAAWEAGFYPIYAEAQHVFGVNWLLLASIHDQETAFSTAPTTYRGLNFARCCGGPMQFNVTNGPVTTWALVKDAYRYGKRPAVYDHETTRHPSIYDDFDSVMAAAWLLSSDGAGAELDDSAWWAAYDYYGHDATGVAYADEVLARAIGWSQHGFCVNCGVDMGLVEAVHAAYGAPVLETLTTATLARVHHGKHARRSKR